MSYFSDSLARVHIAAKNQIVRSSDISRADRERLIQERWLQPIVRGWYLLTRPDMPIGESSAWYANFWDFIGLYLQDLYGTNYCLSAESSLDLHINPSTVPKQIIVIAEKGNNTPLTLPFNTSLLTYRDPSHIPEEKEEIKGTQVMSLAYALCKVTSSYFIKNAQDGEIAFRLIKDSSEFIRIILQYDFKRAANRVVGAYRFLQNNEMADQIQAGLEKAHFRVSAENPFEEKEIFLPSIQKIQSPYVARIYALWNSYRQKVIEIFPSPHKRSKPDSYFAKLEKIYIQDAYNSLSIEGYRVDQELIEKIGKKGWNPETHFEDRLTKDALAALGYHRAFQAVKESIARIFKGASPVEEAKKNLHYWMRCLFEPMVESQILKPENLAGYRRGQVYIRGSRHIPFPKEALLDAMEALYICLSNETHPAVQAILGHFLFVYIHPFMDGNGRTARFLMNVMFASGGYPWTIIQVKNRSRYFSALEAASTGGQIEPLARFIAEEMEVN